LFGLHAIFIIIHGIGKTLKVILAIKVLTSAFFSEFRPTGRKNNGFCGGCCCLSLLRKEPRKKVCLDGGWLLGQVAASVSPDGVTQQEEGNYRQRRNSVDADAEGEGGIVRPETQRHEKVNDLVRISDIMDLIFSAGIP
jgi:hypothetical protein